MDIRLLTQADIPAAMHLKELAKWNQTERDWQRLLELEPKGCFAACCDGKLVGTATTTLYGSSLAWIGMVLVDPEYRRRGIAKQLMKTAMEYLRRTGVATIKLDATPAGLPVYEALGFVVEGIIERHSCYIDSPRIGSKALFNANRLEAMIALDHMAFAANRSRLLQLLRDDSLIEPAIVHTGSLQGYALARRGAHAHYIGPIVAINEAVAPSLLSSLLERMPAGHVYVDYLTGFAGVDLQRFGFAKQRELYRMRCGAPFKAGSGAKIFAIAGPEVG
jgi:GNAT superfamily N-acetyltransferase